MSTCHRLRDAADGRDQRGTDVTFGTLIYIPDGPISDEETDEVLKGGTKPFYVSGLIRDKERTDRLQESDSQTTDLSPLLARKIHSLVLQSARRIACTNPISRTVTGS